MVIILLTARGIAVLFLLSPALFCPYLSPMKLKNKWVLITGASSGFGAAAARSFAAEGARLLLGARRLDRLAKVQTNAIGIGAAEAHYHALDVSKTAGVNDFMKWAGEKIKAQNPKGRLD